MFLDNIRSHFFDKDVLKAIVCGYERGGTTLLTQLLTAHPRLESGFESGLLLADKPENFLLDKFSDYNDSLIKGGWDIDDDGLEYILKCKSWNQVYARLRERSGIVKNKKSYLVDKTPIYMLYLNDVLSRIADVRCIVVVKEPRGVIYSWLKRRPNIDFSSIPDQVLRDCCIRYESYARGYNLAKINHPERILKVDYERLCLSPELAASEIFAHIGFDYSCEYLFFEEKYEVYGNTISERYLCEYKSVFSTDILSKIDRWTAEAIKLLSVN